ncbi:putative hydroxypyruvate isomerase [Tetranychus urticae]|uniref:Putative hydroxypyruvate isomerase n=1 Tax=Tetranychus urticae TaxID=32264 RepID=T1KAE9_TETUR|nr:putative hydroxypyruvate isomerase [Tetranychus urticae]
MKFAANLSTMFSDLPTLQERYEYVCFKCPVKFDAIECQDPYMLAIKDWRRLFENCSVKGAKLPKWELINSVPLFLEFPDLRIPSFEEYRLKVLDKTLEYAKFLDCQKVHLILGDLPFKSENPDQITHLTEKMTTLLYQAAHYLELEHVNCVIEPLSLKERERYYLRSYKLAVKILEQNTKSKNLRLLTDIYHLQRVEGNLTEAINKYMPLTGHVQISQVPLRDCPFNEGEINYRYVLEVLRKVHRGFIGLEYKCTTEDDLLWINNYTN